MVGTIINVAAVAFGSVVGAAIGNRLPDRIRTTVLQGLGLITTTIGLQMALQTRNILVVLGAVLVGGIIGELLRIHDGLERLGGFLQSVLARGGSSQFSEGFVTASLLFCIGPMAILGSIQDGLTGDYQLLTVKSILDGFASIAFAASLGWGVGCAALSVLCYQGAITLLANMLERLLAEPMVLEMTATGGILIMGIGIKLLNIRDIRLASFLPALVLAPLIVFVVTVIKSFMG
ncbi:MAG TPA: DUF554 domain-containing protein [Syntrophobacteraceae bacterium]|nr:DUF554 domain-containing protein [Syntrophobacteraceae bacterium]